MATRRSYSPAENVVFGIGAAVMVGIGLYTFYKKNPPTKTSYCPMCMGNRVQ